jgi:signal transduction histidine kinase
MPRAARFLVIVVVLGAAAVLARQLGDTAAWTGRDLLSFALVGVAAAGLEQFWIPFRQRAETQNFSVTDTVFAAGLMLLRPSAFLLAVAAGAVAGEACRRVAPHKIAFKAGRLVLALALADAVYNSFETPPEFGDEAWLAAVAAMAAYFIANASAAALLVALVERKGFFEVLVPPLRLRALHSACNVALGIVAAFVWLVDPSALPLVVVPLGLCYVAYLRRLQSEQGRKQMHAMARAADAISLERDLARRIPETDASGDVALLVATLNRMLKRLESAFRREHLFIDEASHELRTPITISRGHLEVLGPSAGPEEMRQAIDLVLDELALIGRIVEDMTTLASVEQVELVAREPVPLRPFLAELAAQARPLVDGRLRTGSVPDGVIVHADPQRLTQALLNLLHNAALYTPAGSPVTLRVQEEPVAWRFEVADEGDGLPAGQEEVVFQPFHRATSLGPGSGLGLAIVRTIAEAHGGSAGVDNKSGEGATFWLRVPR